MSMTPSDLQRYTRPVLVALPAAGLLAGLALSWLGQWRASAADWAPTVWIAATLPVLAALLVEIISSLRKGEFGLDIVAALSMSAALSFGETLAAAVVALMYAGGQYLESYAERRARREMTALLSRAPRFAMRHRDGGLEQIALEAVEPGDRLMIRRGDVVPADGTLCDQQAMLDEAALTGESLPVRRKSGESVMSGATNAGDAFDMVATRRAADSTYAGIVRLVEQAQQSKAPMARMADRFSLGFLALTLLIAGAAWYVTGDPVRAVAVLVVATPCPLILAVPVSLVAGLSRAASHGILIKGAKALETLGTIKSIVVDKTGTLTVGEPRLTGFDSAMELDELLRVAASLEQASQHTIAQSVVAEARRKGLALAVPDHVTETPGEGMEGVVAGSQVVVGGRGFVAGKLGLATHARDKAAAGTVCIAVAIDGRLAGTLILADELRTGTAEMIASLRQLGVERVVLATGDRWDVAQKIAAGLRLDAVRSGLTPDQKVLVVLSERKYGPVMMVGDGVNDAPALAAADLGVAMGARGASASAEAADMVLLVDRLDRIVPGLQIAHRSRAIALQSVYAGIGLSLAGMVAAALGFINPVEGALLQEVIDVAAILNALRALRIPALAGK